MDPDDLRGLAVGDDTTRFDEDRPVAELGHPVHVVGDEDDGLGACREFKDTGLALLAEDLVARREHLIEKEDVRIHRGGEREPKAGAHPG